MFIKSYRGSKYLLPLFFNVIMFREFLVSLKSMDCQSFYNPGSIYSIPYGIRN
jgi:hypothetical protein